MKHRVERAVILAAGKGERLLPITEHLPKPLIAVQGERMVETLLQRLIRLGLQEIYLVVGYHKERFSQLLNEYPEIRVIDNPYYDTADNIGSLYAARAHLENAIILDGGQLVYDDDALALDFERSGYNAVWTDEPTDEWLLTVENGIVTDCSRTGGAHGWQLYSISRWTAADGRKLKAQLEAEWEKSESRTLCWDDLPLFLYRDAYRLGIRPMCPDEVVEIDTLGELAAIDISYAGLLACESLDKQTERW